MKRQFDEESKFLVGMGNNVWPVTSATPQDAIREVKERILRENRSQSLVNLVASNNADILVMNESRDEFYACETHGTYLDDAPDEVLERMARLLPPRKFRIKNTKPGN